MQHKSNIQLIKESIEFKNNLLNELTELTDKYCINDTIFTYNQGLKEVCDGFFESFMETDNLKEIVENYNDNMGIRISGDKYQIGNLYKSITEAKNINKVLEINHI